MDMAVDLVAGGVSGVVTAAVGYPFDTLKVLMQNYGGTYFHGYRDCVQKVYQQYGLAGFYSGVPARLTSAAVEYSLTFGGYYGAMRLAGADLNNPTWWQIALGGAGGGLATTAVLTPLELVKCTMQAADVASSSSAHGAAPPRSTADCVRIIYHRGGLRGFYQGGMPMLLREVPGTALWCGANDRLRYWLTPAEESTANLTVSRSLLAGGLSGVIYSVCIFPFDVIKTRVQVDPAFRHLSLWQSATRQYEEGGVRALYRGFGVAAVLSFPASALTFGVFQLTARTLSAKKCQPELFSNSHVLVQDDQDERS